MFCSWRKSSCAPCSCAYLLRGRVSELLNHLCCLGRATLVLRQQGLSLAKSTLFGLCVADREGGWNVLRDHLSGLETDTRTRQNLYLLTDISDRRPMLGMGEPGKAMDLSIRLDGHAWESPTIRNLIEHFEGAPLDCMESRRLGAGAWLDEWERPSAHPDDGLLVTEASRLLRNCGELEVEVKTGGHRNRVNFMPSFFDASGSVLRIADRSLRHVVHADLADPELRIRQKDEQVLKMEKAA